MGEPGRTPAGEAGRTPVAEQSSSARLARGLLGVTTAAMLGNLFAYVLLLGAARVLASADYAHLVALLNVLLVGSIPAFALQAIAARRVALGQTRDLVLVGALISLAVGVIFLVLAPAEQRFLRIPGITAELLIAIALPAIAMQGLVQGVWQGRQGFTGLAGTTFVGMLGRHGGALCGLVIGRSTTSAATGIVIGVGLACLASLWPLREHRPRPRSQATAQGEAEPPPGRDPGRLVRESSELIAECGHAAHAYGVFLLLSVSDVLVANHLLPTREAAVYSAGSVITKAALWLPQSAASVLFASLTDEGRHRGLFLRAAAAVAGLGVIVTAACFTVGRFVALAVAGDKYPELHDTVWLFAALGSALAITQFCMVTGLAVRSRRVTFVAWTAVVCEVIAVYALPDPMTVTDVVATVAGVNLVAALACVLARAHTGRPVGPVS
ncbi:hypothetical protein M6D93_12580 [Jatrophihabitans telluris]|uniref:Polysaccharide biosynthesis protein n=1 Tax=Jatrophihabitans telluris TaxID=2038343 RepID=A0ABY4QV12_9ACTN|nr:hypothetical protein [Jatrophihabitans telluris]UQX87134.1 hypothetical protein M6D93_12580 [Jatrophihabitans telluris]